MPTIVFIDDLEAFILQVAGHPYSVGFELQPQEIRGIPTDEEAALWAGFSMAKELGLIDRLPRLVIAQAALENEAKNVDFGPIAAKLLAE